MTSNSTNIELKNQHDTSDIHSLQNTLLWDSRVNTNSDLRSNIISTTAHASKLSTKKYLAHNNLSLVRTQYTVHIPNFRINDPPPPSNDRPPPTGVASTENDMSRNKPPEQVPHVQNDPDSDPSSSGYYSSESSESSYLGILNNNDVE